MRNAWRRGKHLPVQIFYRGSQPIGTVSLSIPTVTVEGAKELTSAAENVASGLAKIMNAAAELKAHEVLGQSRAEYVSKIGGVLRASSRRDAVLELLQNGKTVDEVAEAIGCTRGRVSQIKNESDGRIKRSVERIVDFMIKHGADRRYFEDLMLISGRVAKRILQKMDGD